jgi:CheY-like chemotaxis protein
MSAHPRVLVADDPAAFAAFSGALTSSFTLVHAATLKAARAALDPPPQLVVCGCHFDEGRMYDLLRHLKAAPQLRHVPFMAVRCTEGELDDALYESVKIAVRALGGNAFVDLLRWQRRWGPAEAAHRLTQLVQSLATAPPDTTIDPAA